MRMTKVTRRLMTMMATKMMRVILMTKRTI